MSQSREQARAAVLRKAPVTSDSLTAPEIVAARGLIQDGLLTESRTASSGGFPRYALTADGDVALAALPRA